MCRYGTLGMFFNGGLGSVWFTSGLNDVKGLFPPKLFFDSLISSLDRYYSFESVRRRMLEGKRSLNLGLLHCG